MLSAFPVSSSPEDIKQTEARVRGDMISKEEFENMLYTLPKSTSPSDIKQIEARVRGELGRVTTSLAALPTAAAPTDIARLEDTITQTLASELRALGRVLRKRTRNEDGDDEGRGRRQRQRIGQDERAPRRPIPQEIYGGLLKIKVFTEGGLVGFQDLSSHIREATLAWISEDVEDDWYNKGRKRASCIGNIARSRPVLPDGQPNVACDRCCGAKKFCLRKNGPDLVLFPLHSTDRVDREMDEVAYWRRTETRRSNMYYKK